jgi:hypothetical protein
MGKWMELKKGLEAPTLFARPINRFYHRNIRQTGFNPSGEPIMDKDWDICLVLDACRYDMFAEQSELPGTTEQRESLGSATSEFLLGNFSNGSYSDTVYVSANPQLENHWDEMGAEFHAIRHVWSESWDPTYQTVLPTDTRKAIIEAREEFPNKRIIGHFLQPHYPFLTSEIEADKGKFENPEEEIGIWKKFAMGRVDISQKDLWRAYCETLDRALGELELLFEELSGKIAVTADHGNFVGERSGPVPVREFGHPVGIYQPELVQVPWHTYTAGARPEIIEGEVTSESGVNEKINSHLRALGYAE